jgi:hypothetical protein
MAGGAGCALPGAAAPAVGPSPVHDLGPVPDDAVAARVAAGAEAANRLGKAAAGVGRQLADALARQPQAAGGLRAEHQLAIGDPHAPTGAGSGTSAWATCRVPTPVPVARRKAAAASQAASSGLAAASTVSTSRGVPVGTWALTTGPAGAPSAWRS